MKSTWIRHGLKELKFIRTLDDVRIFVHQKLPFFLSRVSGNPARDRQVPLSLQIEPTNICNVKCICCSTAESKRAKGFMDFALFRKIVDDASKAGVRRIHLYLHGEPMLHPQIVGMIRHIKSKSIGFTMTTNGMALQREKVEAILDSGVNSADYIVFSILGYSREVHEKIMRGVDHSKVEANVDAFRELRKKSKANGPILETVFFRMPENEHEEEKFIKKWEKKVDRVHQVLGISQQFAGRADHHHLNFLRDRTCKNLWERMTIYWNGDVTICTSDLDGKHVYGNAREQSVKELWNSEKLLQTKRLHKEGRFAESALCSKCDWHQD